MFDEDGFISRDLRPLAAVPGASGFTDDAAVVAPPPGCELVITGDTIVAGVHFPFGERADLIAIRAVRVNISDLVAKGADPIGYLLHITVPRGTEEGFGADFCAGLTTCQKDYGIGVLGGDTVVAPEDALLSVSVTAFGAVPRAQSVRRFGAQPKDVLFVSGTIGDAALGLLAARGDPLPDIAEADVEVLEASYRLPRPPFGLQQAIRRHARASLDISDGLVGDLERLCRASGVAARVDVAKVPLSDAVTRTCARDQRLMKVVLTGGDDYQVLASVPVDRAISFAHDAREAGHMVKAIGKMLPGPPQVSVLDRDGEPMAFRRTRYSHRA